MPNKANARARRVLDRFTRHCQPKQRYYFFTIFSDVHWVRWWTSAVRLWSWCSDDGSKDVFCCLCTSFLNLAWCFESTNAYYLIKQCLSNVGTTKTSKLEAIAKYSQRSYRTKKKCSRLTILRKQFHLNTNEWMKGLRGHSLQRKDCLQMKTETVSITLMRGIQLERITWPFFVSPET